MTAPARAGVPAVPAGKPDVPADPESLSGLGYLIDQAASASPLMLVTGASCLASALAWLALRRSIGTLFGPAGHVIFLTACCFGLLGYFFAGSPDLGPQVGGEREETIWFSAAASLNHEDPQVRRVAAKALLRLLARADLAPDPTGKLSKDFRMATGWLLLARALDALDEKEKARASLEIFKVYHARYGDKLFDSLAQVVTPRTIRIP